MIVFWSISALLVAVALLFLLPPLLRRPGASRRNSGDAINLSLYRDQFAELENDLRNDTITAEQCERSVRELQYRLLEEVPAVSPATVSSAVSTHTRSSRIVAVLLGFAIPVSATALYFQLGHPEMISAEKTVATKTKPKTGQEQLDASALDLLAYLEKNPQDVRGWHMLARSRSAAGRYDEALGAYEKLAALAPNSAQLWAEYAVALAKANGKRLQGKPVEFLKKALELDPDNKQALATMGRAEYDSGNLAEAISYWEHLLTLLPKDAESTRSVEKSLARARALAESKKVAGPNGRE